MANKNIKVKNFVFEDSIWRNHIAREEKTLKQWGKNWQFVKDNFDDHDKALEEHKMQSGKLPIKPKSQDKFESEVKPSVPQTSRGLIGWRAGKPECNLEMFGTTWTRRNGSLYKQLEWPIEAIS